MTEQSEQATLMQLIAQRPSGVTVFCVGVGNEVNRPLLTQMAEEAGGLVAFVSAGDDFSRQAQAFRRKLVHPAAKNVKLAFQGVDVYDLEPETIPNLYHGQPIRVYGRYKNKGTLQIQASAEIQGSPWEQRIEMDLPGMDESNPQLDRMWASHRVARLLDKQRTNGSEENASEIVRLCEGYSIVSQYASFLVLENDAEYQRWQITRRNATRIERDRTAQAALRRQLDQLQAQASSQLGPQEQVTPTEVANSIPSANNPSTPDFSGANQVVTPNFSPSTPGDVSYGDGGAGGASGGGGGGGGFGGAIDPVTALIGLGMAGVGVASRLRRRKTN
jgi:Ca-activated chloride channel family protein